MRHRVAKSAHEVGQAAVRGGNGAFHAGLQHAAQNRRSPAGRNRNDKRVAIKDRGHDEVAKSRPVGDVDPCAGVLRRRPGLGRQAFVLGGDEAERGVLEVVGRGISRLVAKVRLIEKLAKIVAERGRECRHARAGLDEVFRPSRRHRAAAYNDCGLAGELKKNRQMAHGYRARDRNARSARFRDGRMRG